MLQTKKNYHNGKLDGKYLHYHEYELNKKIQLKVKAFYRKGKLEGEYLEYDEQGRLIGMSFYKNGKLEGEYLHYNKGILVEKRIYNNGVLIEVKPNTLN